MKEKLKFLLGWVISIVVTFVFIYFFVFFGGWKLFESGDPILIELGAAVVIGTVIFLVYGVTRAMEKEYSSKITDLEKRIEELEHKNNM